MFKLYVSILRKYYRLKSLITLSVIIKHRMICFQVIMIVRKILTFIRWTINSRKRARRHMMRKENL